MPGPWGHPPGPWSPGVQPSSSPMHGAPAGGRPLSIAEACEAAGRGTTSGMTVQDTDISVFGPDERPVRPQHYDTFDEVREFPREIQHELRRAGFPGPSQVQSYCWPLALGGKDVIGIAATGSGKTLAFLLPAFCEMRQQGTRPERTGPGLLVMAPTRELAQQTESEAIRFGHCMGMKTVAMYGGSPKRDQIAKYRMGVHSIVACPGRLNDFLEGGQIRLDGVMKLVLDEADRMLDMGFEPQIRKILEKLPRKRHTLFFTATWPKEVRKLASEILYQPYKVMIGNRDVLKANQDVIQLVRMVEGFDKNRAMMDLLHEAGLNNPNSVGKALVFSNTKRGCDQLSQFLYRSGVSCSSIHGDKDQVQRDEALNSLKNGRIKVLVATDVAARGLDIKGIGLVVNYDPANNTEDYVHRIGRTGRAGAKGFSVTFMSRQDASRARGMVEVMQRTGQEIPRELQDMARSSGGERRDRWGGSRGGSSSAPGPPAVYGGGGGGGWRPSGRPSGGFGGGNVNSLPVGGYSGYGGGARSRSPRRR
mmetsp:Transcript_31356/g.61564  ORF Transcript_31356/g.61564 Transcript_31356/m.61564 type:complete len:534 (-) Transcript_31356:81-1682(-)